jgi:SAM-dependent methyltransferase
MSGSITVDLDDAPRETLPPEADDWDKHWMDFSAASESAPATLYRRRLSFRLLGIKPREASVRMLEIGCGIGGFAEEFWKRFPQTSLLGIDLSRAGVESSSRRVPSARFMQRDLLQPAQPHQHLDFGATHVLCSEVLEHVDDPALLLRRATEYMAPGCKLVVTVPGGRRNAFDEHIGHRRHYTPAELAALLESAGFTVESAFGAGFPFFNLYRLLITLRGRRLIQDVSGRRGLLVRAGGVVFGVLLRLNLMHPWGWQTVAIARYRSVTP